MIKASVCDDFTVPNFIRFAGLLNLSTINF